MKKHWLSRRVNKTDVFSCFQNAPTVDFRKHWEWINGLYLYLLNLFFHFVYATKEFFLYAKLPWLLAFWLKRFYKYDSQKCSQRIWQFNFISQNIHDITPPSVCPSERWYHRFSGSPSWPQPSITASELLSNIMRLNSVWHTRSISLYSSHTKGSSYHLT